MPILNRLAHSQSRRDELPNQELARDLAATRDKKSIRELVQNLSNPDPNISSDCLKVLYEIAALDPKLIAPYAAAFLQLLESKNNRLVWGSMTALAAIAPLTADELFVHYPTLVAIIERGSVITRDNGIKTLALVAAHSAQASKKIFPYLLQTLETCRPKEIPQYAESIAVAVNPKNRAQFINVLESRLLDMPPSRAARINRVIKQSSSLK